jgi:hypothetical protein
MQNTSTTVINASKRMKTVHSAFTDCSKYIQLSEVKMTISCFCAHTHARARTHTHTHVHTPTRTHTHKATKVTEFEEMFSNWFATPVTLPQAW